jgi:hypothetical protein
MPAIVPGSAFDPAFKSDIDWREFGPMKSGLTKRQSATKQREAQQALGRHGTIHGLSPKSDEQIAKIGRMRKSSALG